MATPAAAIAIMLVLSTFTFTSSTRVALAEGNETTTTTTTTLPADGFTIGDIGKAIGEAIDGAISAMTAPISGFFAWLGAIKIW